MSNIVITSFCGSFLNNYNVLGCNTWDINGRNFSQPGLKLSMAVTALFMPACGDIICAGAQVSGIYR